MEHKMAAQLFIHKRDNASEQGQTKNNKNLIRIYSASASLDIQIA
jgi:hypothetical protein